MHEVADIGDGTVAGGLEAIRPAADLGLRQDVRAARQAQPDELRRDRSRTKLAQAVTLYHVVVEATLAQPGQHFIEDYLTKRDLLPGFRGGMRNVALDEQRHIGFGVKLLRDLAPRTRTCPPRSADLLREVLPYSAAVFVPPGWDRRYTECFGFTRRGDLRGGRALVREQAARRRPADRVAAGPDPLPVRPRRRRSAPGAAIAMLQAGLLGEGERRDPARPGDDGAAVRLLRRAVDPRHAPSGPLTLQWDFPTPSRGTCGSTTAHARRAGLRARRRRHVPRRYDDFVDVFAGRLDPRRALLTGKLQPRGSVKALWSTRRIFG